MYVDLDHHDTLQQIKMTETHHNKTTYQEHITTAISNSSVCAARLTYILMFHLSIGQMPTKSHKTYNNQTATMLSIT